MGLFGDLRRLGQVSAEVNKGWDPAAQMRQANAQMQQMQQSMQAQTADLELERTGMPGTATIIGMLDTGARLNLQPIVRIDLLVEQGDRPPYPVTRATVLPVHASAQAGVGQRVSVKVDPNNAGRVLVRWGQPGR